jgi:hypothetical protein
MAREGRHDELFCGLDDLIKSSPLSCFVLVLDFSGE